MTTLSYPVQNKNLTSVMWSKLLRRNHQGVDVSTVLTLSPTSNDATISAPSRLNFMGYELEVTEPHVVTLPAVTSAKTYVIGVAYDPANEAVDPVGPLSIFSGVKGQVSVPDGGALWPIWEVTRQPSQTLNLASVKSYRVARASVLFADAGVADPDPTFAQGVQLLVRRTGIKVLDGGQWRNVEDDTGDRTDGVTTPADWSSAGTVWRVRNGSVDVDIRGTLKTGSGQTGNANSGGLSDFRMCTLPPLARPRRTKAVQGSITTAGSVSGTFPIFGVIQANGDFVITATAPGVPVGPGCTLYVSASYLGN